MSIEIELRFPTVAYGYAGVKITGNSPDELQAQLAGAQKQIALAIQLAGGGDSAAQAERLLGEQLGAVRIQEDGSPWSKPNPAAEAVAQPWQQGPAAPPVESAGPAPFGAPAPGGAFDGLSTGPTAPATNAFGALTVGMQRSPVIKNLPFIPDWDKPNFKDPQSIEGKQVKIVKDYCYKAKSKVIWDAGRKGYGFENAPSADTLAWLRANLPAIGASLEE